MECLLDFLHLNCHPKPHPLQVFRDGLLMASAVTHKTRPLQPGGALMLGAERDCYGGCTDRQGLAMPSWLEGREWPCYSAE